MHINNKKLIANKIIDRKYEYLILVQRAEDTISSGLKSTSDAAANVFGKIKGPK